MQLCHISIPLLVAAAGGDPWAINKSLQIGRPIQISDLAEAFHAAGRCTTEANTAFDEAHSRFKASWNRENGDNPINDSAEVQHVVRSLGAQSLQLPKIGVDLENIAAALAEAQRSANGQIATLEGQLHRLDDLIGQALDREKDVHVTADEMPQLDGFIRACEEDAIKDTEATVGQIQSTRNGYIDCLQKSLNNLRTEGYDPAAIHGLDSDVAPAPSPLQSGELADIRLITNQAVVDQMGKVRAAQDAIDKALAAIYTHGPGSLEAEAAAQSLPKLKADLAHALDALGKIPDYNKIDPASISTTPDGRFMFTYNVDGQSVQVFGQLRKGSGEFFDQATGTSYTFNDGKLTGMRTLDPGKVEATAEPLWSAITLAVGAPELKAGGEVAWQGLKTLFSREALAGLTSDNVLPRAISAAEARAAIAEADLPPRSIPPSAGGQPIPGIHPGPAPVVGPVPPAVQADILEHVPGEHVPAVPDSPLPVVTGPGHPPGFTLDNPLNYMSPELRAMSEQHLTGSGETVLGPFKPPLGGPSYIDLAQQHKASYFDLGDAWYSFTPTEQLAANQHVLDIAIANHDRITLSVPFYRVDPNSYTAAEIRYLEAHGYHRLGDNALTPPIEGAR